MKEPKIPLIAFYPWPFRVRYRKEWEPSGPEEPEREAGRRLGEFLYTSMSSATLNGLLEFLQTKGYTK